MNGPSMRTMGGLEAERRVDDVDDENPVVPPRISEAWGPSPAESVVVAPGTAVVRHVAPRIARGPYVSVLRIPNPTAAAIRLPIAGSGFIWRPDVSLAGHVVPIAIRVEIAPGWIAAVGLGFGCSGLRRLLRRQLLVAIGIPRVPGVRLDRISEVVLVGIAAVERNAFASAKVQRKSISAFQMRIAREHGDLARRVIHVDAQHREAASCYGAIAK